LQEIVNPESSPDLQEIVNPESGFFISLCAMKVIPRHVHAYAREAAATFRAVCLMGPRQSGKTTLSKIIFGQLPYVSFEDPQVERAVTTDGKIFLKRLKKGAILDEVQRVPDMFRYLQGELDTTTKRGRYILTGSSNFLLQEQISQSLAGRVGYLELLPLSYAELSDADMASDSLLQHILKGGYPEIWQQRLNPTRWVSSYIQTYVQRDVRLIRNIVNISTFNRFLMLCAMGVGKVINKDAWAQALGVDAKTIQSWLSVLESSYIIYLLPPYHQNLNKRIIKAPKLYFYDTAVLCQLLAITSASLLMNHQHYGFIVENWIITEIKKNKCNRGEAGGLYFFRDSAGNELDLILEKNGTTIPIEIKAAKKISTDMFNGLRYWRKNNPGNVNGILIYQGKSQEPMNGFSVLNWTEVADI
jgi:uncharacterized protein